MDTLLLPVKASSHVFKGTGPLSGGEQTVLSPQGTRGNVWGFSWGGGATGTTTKKAQAPNVDSAEIEKCCLRDGVTADRS